VAYKNDTFKLQFTANLNRIPGVADERAVLQIIIRGRIRSSGTDVIKQYGSIAGSKFWLHVAPHCLVAAKAMSEKHSLFALTGNANSVAIQDIHT
jgi:hypothetical protein